MILRKAIRAFREEPSKRFCPASKKAYRQAFPIPAF